jgi:hypothetical protein
MHAASADRDVPTERNLASPITRNFRRGETADLRGATPFPYAWVVADEVSGRPERFHFGESAAVG